MKPSKAADERPFIELSRPERGKVFAIAWSPDGQYIVVGTEQGLWIYTDTFADVTHAEDKPIHALAWSPDGKTIAAGYFGVQEEATEEFQSAFDIEGGGLRLWSVQKTNSTIALTRGTELIRKGSVYSLRFKPDGSRLAVLVENEHNYQETILGIDSLQIFALESGKSIYNVPTEFSFMYQDDRMTQGANGLDWSSDGQLTVFRRLNRDDLRETSFLEASNDKVAMNTDDLDRYKWVGMLTAVDWNSDNTKLAISSEPSPDPDTWGGVSVCDRDGAACIDPPLISAEDTALFESASIHTLAWQPQHSLLAYSQKTAIRLWDANTQKVVADLDVAHAAVTMLAWKPDGSALLSAGSDFVVRLWTRFDSYQRPDPQPFQTITLPTRPNGLLSPDGRWLVIPHIEDKKSPYLTVINQQNGSERTILMLPDENTQQWFSWSPDSTVIESWRSPNQYGCGGVPPKGVQLWSAETGNLLLDLGFINGLAWRPDNQAVAVGRYVNYNVFVIEVWDIASSKLVQTSPPSNEWGQRFPFLEWTSYSGHNLSVSRWSPDGRLVALSESVECGSYEPTSVKLWEPESNLVVGELVTWRSPYRGSGNNASLGAWSPDGTLAAVSGFDDDFLYRLRWQDDLVVPELIWQPVGTSFYADDWYRELFSPNSRYFVFGSTVINTRTLWPVFKFRNTMLGYDDYRWEGDMLIAVNRSDETTEGTEVYFRTSDFLPE